ncbi:hypothetical protein TNCV_1051801 [Trichonephila clavipes]|nr:hypothetical protein TNCV_1051801 [Trichonephila clavipes]
MRAISLVGPSRGSSHNQMGCGSPVVKQSFCFASALASETVVDEVRGSSVLASLARKSAPSRSLPCQHGQGSTGGYMICPMHQSRIGVQYIVENNIRVKI